MRSVKTCGDPRKAVGVDGGTAIGHSSRNGIEIRSTLMMETGFFPGSIWNHVKKVGALLIK